MAGSFVVDREYIVLRYLKVSPCNAHSKTAYFIAADGFVNFCGIRKSIHTTRM